MTEKIAERLAGMPEEAINAYIKTRGVGSHSEIYAVNELMLKRASAKFEDIAVYTMETQRKSELLTFKPACLHCDYLLKGVTYVK